MRRDFQIAILLALAAIPAGVSLMAAPEYIGILKEYPGSFFWAGLILAALLIGAAIIIALRGEASEPRIGHTRRVIALTGMIVLGLGFLGPASVYFWPSKTYTNDFTDAVKNAYLHDFNLLSQDINLTMPGPSLSYDHKTVEVLGRIYYDFEARGRFVAFYFSSSANIMAICKQILPDLKKIIENAESRVQVQGGRVGQMGMVNGRDLPFSGRVFLYHHMPITTDDILSVLTLGKQNNLDVIFRGYDYVRGKG
jgi:hypothetical protein